MIYCGTFSKTVVPGLRIGWIVAPRPVIERLVLIKQASDLHTSALNQMAMLAVAQAIVPRPCGPDPCRLSRAPGCDARARSRPRCRRGDLDAPGRRDVLLGDPARATRRRRELLERAIGTAGVAFVPGAAFYPDRSVRNALRLSFSLNPPAEIELGIAKLAQVIRNAG